jgi:1-deoxy-D-xylulose-5-phosphate reductoisomerase
MMFPIAHSLFYPRQTPKLLLEKKPFQFEKLHFEKPDPKRYKAIRLAYHCGEAGGTATGIFNAANEIAVERFLNKEISFLQIPEVIDVTLQKIPIQYPSTLEEFLESDSLARKTAKMVFVT